MNKITNRVFAFFFPFAWAAVVDQLVTEHNVWNQAYGLPRTPDYIMNMVGGLIVTLIFAAALRVMIWVLFEDY